MNKVSDILPRSGRQGGSHMARKRMIDPGIWQSEDFSKLSTLSKIIFIGLFSNADDAGRGRAKAVYIKSMLFPYDDNLRVADIEKTLEEIASNMSITFYSHDGNEYYSLDNWRNWQKIDKPTPSKIPPPDDPYSEIRGTLAEDSPKALRQVPPNRIEQEKNKKGTENNLLPEAETAPACQPVITLTLNDKSEYPIYQQQIDEWSSLYLAVDVMQALREMKGWIQANPTKRKTKSGILRFITNWLSKNQNQGGAGSGANQQRNTTADTPAGNTGTDKPKYGTTVG